MGWLLIPLILFLVKRFYSRSRVKRTETSNKTEGSLQVEPGADSFLDAGV